MKVINIEDALNNEKWKVSEENLTRFSTALSEYVRKIENSNGESEEHLKKYFSDFLKNGIFYNNIYNTYLKFIEGMDAQDDITIVVAIFQPPKPIETQENNDGKEII